MLARPRRDLIELGRWNPTIKILLLLVPVIGLRSGASPIALRGEGRLWMCSARLGILTSSFVGMRDTSRSFTPQTTVRSCIIRLAGGDRRERSHYRFPSG
jgi:hypothetical protein